MIIDLVKVIFQGVLLTGRIWLDLLIKSVRKTNSRVSVFNAFSLFQLLRLLAVAEPEKRSTATAETQLS